MVVRVPDEAELLRVENEHLLETQRELEAQCDLYAAAYDGNPVPSLVLDRDGVVRVLNAAAAALLGRPPRRLQNHPFRMLVDEADRPTFLRHLERCRREPGPVGSELAVTRPGEAPLAVELWSARMQHQEALHATVILDIRERLAGNLERSALREAERAARAESEAKDQFIATISHELRTPLTPVLAAVSALTARDASLPPSPRVLEMIQRNVLAEARLIDDLLDASRIRRGKLRIERQPVDVHEVVGRAVEVLAVEARSKGVGLEVQLEAPAHHASADPLRLRQVFWNLVGNAVKFTAAGGLISVRSWNRQGDLAVEVRDNGMGLVAGDLERLFRPFEQGPDQGQSRQGLGLGLAIARGVMELHGGRIVGSSPGRGHGARFIVELATIPEPQVPAVVRAPPAKATGHRRILLVEDHQDTADSLAELLAAEGYEVKCAGTAAAARAQELDGIDLVVSDLGLPDGSGLDLLRELHGRRRLPAIALSGYGTEADVRASQEAGFSAHLTKPVEWSELLATIDRVAAAG